MPQLERAGTLQEGELEVPLSAPQKVEQEMPNANQHHAYEQIVGNVGGTVHRWKDWQTWCRIAGAALALVFVATVLGAVQGAGKLTSAVQDSAVLEAHAVRFSSIDKPKPGPTCNKSVRIPSLLGRGEFNLTSPWKEKCATERHPDWSWEWPGQNWCWNWMKRTCSNYGTQLPWQEIQVKAAKQGVVPQLHEFRLAGLKEPQLCDLKEPEAVPFVTEAERKAAYAWFDATVSVYVLNLPKDVNRWIRMSWRLKQLGIKFTRIPGVDLTAPGAVAAAQEQGLIPKSWSKSRAWDKVHELGSKTPFGGVGYTLQWAGVGTVGCATAHINAIKQAENFTRENGRQIALIMEDDVFVEDDMVVKAYRLVQKELPCDWQVLSLSSGCPYGTCVSPHLARIQFDKNIVEEACGQGVSYGMFGMMYKVSTMSEVRKRLIQTVFDDNRPACISVDTAVTVIASDSPVYAVPAFQRMMLWPRRDGPSSRLNMNHAKVSSRDAQLETSLKTKGG